MIDAPKITSAPAKIANKGNLPKKLKADAKKSSRSTPTPTPPPVVHDKLSSSDESEAEEQQNRAVESSSDDGGMSPSEEIPVPQGFGDDDDEGMRKKTTFHGNVAFLSLSNSRGSRSGGLVAQGHLKCCPGHQNWGVSGPEWPPTFSVNPFSTSLQ